VTTASAADETVKLVLGIARLGEADLADWWGCHGLDRAGSYVLSRTFRRTWRQAALELDIEAAARRHRAAAGGRALHLFSDELPLRRWAEAWLAEQKTTTQPADLFEWLAGWDLSNALAAIEDWAGAPGKAEVIGEGLRLGTLTRVETEDPVTVVPVARLLAASYLIIDGPFRVPYFELQG